MEETVGRGWAFPPRFSKISNTVALTESNQEEIEQSLMILFHTKQQERLFHPQYGCNIEDYQFLGTDTMRIKRLEKLFREIITEFEPRISLDSLSINSSEILNGKLMLTIAYTILETGNEYNMVYPFNFK